MTDTLAPAIDLLGDITTIKAVSLWQPWASLIAWGVKTHETRDWPTRYRGPIAICAAKTLDPAGAPEALCRDLWGPNWRNNMPLGQVVAVAELTACKEAGAVRCSLTRADHASGNFDTGRFAWKLREVRPLRQPLPVLGRQGLFNWAVPDDIELRLERTVDHLDCCRRIGWL